MSQNVAPWLQGLEEDCSWDVPVKVSSASHNATDIQSGANNSTTSYNRLSQRGSRWHSKDRDQRSDHLSDSTIQRKRTPLGTIDNNEHAAHAVNVEDKSTEGSRPASIASDGSVCYHGTVQQRSKSASPTKSQATLEWKKRLVHGQVGYGDQTDLFGPSGLENIFAQPQSAESVKRGSRLNKAFTAQKSLPSSPPVAVWQTAQASDEGTKSARPAEGLHDALSAIDYSTFRSNSFSTLGSRRLKHGRGMLNLPGEEVSFDDRTIEGPTELEQAEFSPVYISKQTTASGRYDYKALDSHATNVMHPRLNVQSPSSQAEQSQDVEDQILDHSAQLEASELLSCGLANAGVDLSLSENLPTGTPPVVALGKNVELKRGGYSAYGSFKTRALSYSLAIASPLDGEDESSSLVQPSSPVATSPRPLPATPHRGAKLLEPEERSSKSPLKLFGTHDTFTNNRLLRRMSQLNIDSSFASLGIPEAESQLPEDKTDADVGMTFGSGELATHGFNADITITSPSFSDGINSDQSPGSEIPAPGSKTPSRFTAVQSPMDSRASKLKSKIPRRSMPPTKLSDHDQQTSQINVTVAQLTEDDSPSKLVTNVTIQSVLATSKRPPNSPVKDSTPKRRRTLHVSELTDGTLETDESPESVSQQSHNHRKRKDARNGDLTNLADSAVLAQRRLAMPRNHPTAHDHQQKLEAEIREATEQFVEQEPDKAEAVMEQIEVSMASHSPVSIAQQARAAANEVAKFTLRVQKASGDFGERKRSVTTQDFFNEAVMVMKLIREKAGRQHGLDSVAESDQEQFAQSPYEDYSDLDNSALSVSRPPSREGGVSWRPRNSQPTNARVVSHLKRFQERDDTDFIAASIASLDLERDDDSHDDNEETEPSSSELLAEDMEANISIKAPLQSLRNTSRQADHQPRPEGHHSAQSSLNNLSANSSAAPSTGRTLRDSSTRKSENVGTLAPDAVAHLIGNKVGQMTFDKEKQQWIKVKHQESPDKPRRSGSLLDLPSTLTASDDDPFREISDLPVDETKEEQIRTASYDFKRHLNAHRAASQHFGPNGGAKVMAHESCQVHGDTTLVRPTTRGTDNSDSTADLSRASPWRSSQAPLVETRATSWSNAAPASVGSFGQSKHQRLERPEVHLNQPYLADADISSVSLLETSDDSVVEHPQTLKRTAMPTHEISPTTDEETIDYPESEILSSPKLRRPILPAMLPSLSTARPSNRQVSLRRKTLTSRFQSGPTEQSELSFVATLPDQRTMSVSLSVSRPVTSRQPQGQVIEQESSPAKLDPSFMFSDLPSFTVAEDDAERPSERALAERLVHHAAVEVNDRYALAVKDLVKTLTDLHQSEVFWEDVKSLDLCGRALSSLHGLSDFCGGVQVMDVSNNSLTHLDGAPPTIRQLNIRANHLSGLTSWLHLSNLQYLDISSNRLCDFDALANLVHLREVHADDNEIADLKGLMQLDGLLKIRLRRNKIKHVDFDGCLLGRLQVLDLCGNELVSLRNLEMLTSLTSLHLDDNMLPAGLQLEEPMPHLLKLSMRNCDVRELNLSHMPSLRTLQVDDNHLSHIEGVDGLESLDLLSMRRQKLSTGASVSVLQQRLHARKVCLSGNDLSSMDWAKSQLSLQHLEIASAGLQELPADFGIRMPNLTTLNLNFNAIKDIRPLLNIHKLKTLQICGNRLSRMRKSVAVAAKIPALESLDLRDNPLTQGFHPTHGVLGTTRCTSVARRSATGESAHEDEDAKMEEIELARHHLPPADAEADEQHNSRLDAETALRKRVFQLLLGNSCPNLAHLDGLAFTRANAMVKDKVWERLTELDIIKKSCS